MFETIKRLFKNAPEQNHETTQRNEPVQSVEKVEKTEEKQDQKIDIPNTMLSDEKVLRCFILFARHVYSTAAGSCKYIYVNPGFDIFPEKNIDFVQYIYASYGINLKKHISHLDGQEIEVLYISSISYVRDLNKTQQQFLERTAPNVPNFYDMRDRDKETYNRGQELMKKMHPEMYRSVNQGR